MIWKHDPRSIGIMEDDEYFPVIMFNFRVNAYISGPGTNWSGYEVQIMTTDGPVFNVIIEVSHAVILNIFIIFYRNLGDFCRVVQEVP